MSFRLRLAFVILTLVFAPGCFLNPKKKSDKGSGGSGSLSLVKNPKEAIFFDRLASDPSVGLLKFETTKNAWCKMELYTQDPKLEPTKENPRQVACANPEGGSTTFVERLEGLRTDALYVVVLHVYLKPELEGDKQRLVIYEPVGNSSTVVSGGTLKFKDLVVLRLDRPLRSAEVHRHAFTEPLDVAKVREALSRQTGCKTGATESAGPYRAAADDFALKSLQATEFAAGRAIAHPDAKGRQQFFFNAFNEGQDLWSMLFIRDGKDQKVNIRAGNHLQTVEMTSTESATLADAQLAEAVDPLPIDSGRDLVFTWKTDANLLPTAYFTVHIGRPGYEKSTYCVFEASKEKGVVPASHLADLDDGRHVVLARLESSQIWAKDGWLVQTYDWRSGRIEK